MAVLYSVDKQCECDDEYGANALLLLLLLLPVIF